MKHNTEKNEPVGLRNARINENIFDPLPITFESFILHRDIPVKQQFEPLLMRVVFIIWLHSNQVMLQQARNAAEGGAETEA